MRFIIRNMMVAAASLIAVSGSVAQTAPGAGPVSAEVLAAPSSFGGAKLSPNGTKIASMKPYNGKMSLVVSGVGAPGANVLAAGDLDVNWWRWVNDDWLIIGLGDTVSAFGQDFYVTRIAGVSADLSQFKPIDWKQSGQFADDLVYVPNDGSTRILFTKQTGFESEMDYEYSVFEADITTGKASRVIGGRGNVYSWMADNKGTVRLGFGYDESRRKLTMLYRDRAGADFRTMAFDGKKDIAIPYIFTPDGKAITLESENGYFGVYEMNLTDFSVGKKLYSVPGYDVEDIISSEKDDSLLAATYYSNRYRAEWFDPRFKAVQSMLDDAVGSGNGTIIDWDRTGQKLIVHIGDPSQAGGVFYWQPNGGAPQLLGWANQELADRKLNPVKSIRYKARDGTDIEAVLTLPRSRAAKNLPLIVLPHGGPAVRDAEEFDWWSQYLAEQGYAVIQPNYRGSTGYGEKFYELGEGQWGLKMQDDLIDSIAWAKGQGIADDKRVCIVGASYGGYAAMRAAQRDGAHYRCAISFAGVSDLKEMLKYDRRYLLGDNAKKFWRKQAPDLGAVSPRPFAAQFAMPILIVHGAKDKRVPVKQSRLLVQALQKAGKPFKYIEQKEGDHHFSRTEDKLQFLREMKLFLDKNNPA